MLKLTFENYEASSKSKFVVDPAAPFIAWRPDIAKIKQDFEPYRKYKNIIVIGNGGSISSLEAYWRALGEGRSKKKLTIVATMEPDYLLMVRKQNPLDKTLVVAISKSGNTAGVIESLLAFKDYPVIVITTPSPHPLGEMANQMKWPVIAHPPVGGRFTGRSVVAYGPAYLLDIDIDGIEEGVSRVAADYQDPKAMPWQIADFLNTQQHAGRNEIFLPVYSYFLEGFNHLITQLIHESDGKDGKGQTVLAVSAPESQHHTNQRFFGGPKNMAGVFVTVKIGQDDLRIEVPDKCRPIPLFPDKQEGTLEMFNGEHLQGSLQAEARGTMADAKEQGIPFAHLEVDKLTPQAVGEYLVIWQFVAYYLAVLQGVDPFDQPQVERSKEISFSLRKNK